jgi:hypothetical protein
MAYLNDNVLDNGLAWLVTNGTRLDICSQEPTTYAQATSTYTLGNKTSLSIGSPGARTPTGRKVTVAAITNGTVTGTATATHWAITNGSNALVATGALSAGQAVTSGNTFTLTAFDIGIPGPA